VGVLAGGTRAAAIEARASSLKVELPAATSAAVVHREMEDGADPADQLLGADEPDWPAIRDSLTAGIIASATPGRDDRLFPGDPRQFAAGGFNILYVDMSRGASESFEAALQRVTEGGPTPDPGVVSQMFRTSRQWEACSR